MRVSKHDPQLCVCVCVCVRALGVLPAGSPHVLGATASLSCCWMQGSHVGGAGFGSFRG